MVPSVVLEEIPSDTTGDRSRDFRQVAQCLNHNSTPGPNNSKYVVLYYKTFKRTYERWGVRDGEGKLGTETSGDE
jgi:hypothetical protein